MPNQMRPIHPGEVLKGEMETLGLSARQLAMALGVPTNRVTAIVHETRALTADTALRLARYFGTSPEFWLNLQSAYELCRAQQECGARIAEEVRPRVAAGI
jgi:addiction module HigA family antidote